jgi:hypothetical protein
MRGYIASHPEGWRDWPIETPATILTEHQSREEGNGANSSRLHVKAWEMWKG